MPDLVFDVPGSVGILECVEGLHEVSVGRADAVSYTHLTLPTIYSV